VHYFLVLLSFFPTLAINIDAQIASLERLECLRGLRAQLGALLLLVGSRSDLKFADFWTCGLDLAQKLRLELLLTLAVAYHLALLVFNLLLICSVLHFGLADSLRPRLRPLNFLLKVAIFSLGLALLLDSLSL